MSMLYIFEKKVIMTFITQKGEMESLYVVKRFQSKIIFEHNYRLY